MLRAFLILVLAPYGYADIWRVVALRCAAASLCARYVLLLPKKAPDGTRAAQVGMRRQQAIREHHCNYLFNLLVAMFTPHKGK